MCLKKLKKMNTPNKMTESVEEGALIEIKENFRKINTQKTQSSEQFFDLYSAETELNFETKFNQFIGDSEDSTEISDIVSNLCFSSSSSSNYPKINSSENDQKHFYSSHYFILFYFILFYFFLQHYRLSELGINTPTVDEGYCLLNYIKLS